MPQPSKIPLAFAASGDKNTIPESTETTGLASWREGFPAITSVPFSEGGIAPKRADFNGIFYALSQAVMWMQQGGVYAYDVNTDYEAGNVVLDAGGLYVANTANGPSSVVVQPSSDTTGTTWKPVRLDLATQSAAGYMSASDKAALDAIPTTYMKNRVTNLGEQYVMNAADFSSPGFYSVVSLAPSPSGNAPDSNVGDYYLFALDSNSAAYRVIVLISPRYQDNFYVGHFWNGAWNGWHRTESINVRNMAQYGYIYYSSGLQLCWGTGTSSNPPASVSYPRAFSSAPSVLLSATGAADNTNVFLFKSADITTTSFKPCGVFNGAFLSTAKYYYLAIGPGATS